MSDRQATPDRAATSTVNVGRIYDQIEGERRRQEKLRREGRFAYTLATPNGLTDGQK